MEILQLIMQANVNPIVIFLENVSPSEVNFAFI